MGQSQSSITVIDPNQQANRQQYMNLEEILKRAFQQQCINGRLTRDKFNEALSVLEGFNIRRLRDSPISDRLFTVFDKDSSGYLSETEYLEGLTMLINDKEKRIFYSFKIYDRDNDNRVKLQEMYEIVKDSWIQAFRLLSDNIQRGPNRYQLTQQKINTWAQGQLTALYQQLEYGFYQFDTSRSGYMDFQVFRQWVISGEMSHVKAQIDQDEVTVPLNLYKLER